MMKNELDERQNQIVDKVGKISFLVMFGVCVAVIIGQMLWKGSIENVAGETVIFAAGGITYLAGSIKNGIWSSRNRKMSVGQNLLGSVICAGIFSILYAALISGKTTDTGAVMRYTAFFFIGITVLSFLCLYILGKITEAQNRKQEEKYLE